MYANVESLTWIPYLFDGPFKDFSVGRGVCASVRTHPAPWVLTPVTLA